MGFDEAAEVLQLITQELARATVSEAKRILLHTDQSTEETNTDATAFFVHVDNALFVGSKEAINAVIPTCDEVASKMQLTFSERTAEAAEQVVFLGIVFNFPGRWVALT